MPDMNTFLNTAAYTGGPSISTVMKSMMEATFVGGSSMSDGGKAIQKSLAEIHSAVDSIKAAVFTGGTSMPDGGKAIGRSLTDIQTRLTAIENAL